jgi:hypothetical protein
VESLTFPLQILDRGNKRKKNLPHPEAQVRGHCGKKQIDRITNLAHQKGKSG